MRVLVAGITGSVGGELLPVLLAAGHEVVGLSRKPAASRAGVRMLQGDVATGAGLAQALEGVDVAYYLVHSFEQHNPEGFAARDRRAAELFAAAAAQAKVRRIVYCGVTRSDGSPTESAHLRSRAEVASILLSAVPESVCVRTWMILSPANQFVRFLLHLVRQQKIISLPPSARFRFQPVDGRDLGRALLAAASAPELAGRSVDVVGPSPIDTAQLCARISQKLGLSRRILVLPFQPPELLVKRTIQAARLDTTLVLSALASARLGDVLPAQNFLKQLATPSHSFEESLAYAVQA